MGGIEHTATVVVDVQIRVVILAMGNPGDCIHEGNRLVIVVKRELLADAVAIAFPALALPLECFDLVV